MGGGEKSIVLGAFDLVYIKTISFEYFVAIIFHYVKKMLVKMGLFLFMDCDIQDVIKLVKHFRHNILLLF